MNKKYELIYDDYKVFKGVRVYKIRYLINIPIADIEWGYEGGYINSEECLDVNDFSVVRDDAMVIDSYITGNSYVGGDVKIRSTNRVLEVRGSDFVDNVDITTNVGIINKCTMSGNVSIICGLMDLDNTEVRDDVSIRGDVDIKNCYIVDRVVLIGKKKRKKRGIIPVLENENRLRLENVAIKDDAFIEGIDHVTGPSSKDRCVICGRVRIGDDNYIEGDVKIKDNVVIENGCIIRGKTLLKDNTHLVDNFVVEDGVGI